jgi:hypothetical protein
MCSLLTLLALTISLKKIVDQLVVWERLMERTIDIQELSIVIAAKGLNPSLLNPDFLKHSGIVPSDWELARSPAYSAYATQIVFQSGVSVVAQPGTITFSEAFNTKAVDEIVVANLALKYVEKMQNIEYQAVGINPKRIINLDGQAEGTRKYITEALLAPGDWHQLGNTPAQASINLVYNLDRCRFIVNITESRLQIPGEESISAVLFAGSFSYAITAENGAARREQLRQAIAGWLVDVEIYRDLIETKLLAQADSELTFTLQEVV